MSIAPLRFRPILKQRAWGGRALAAFGKSLPDDSLIGESWELADLPKSIQDGRSVVDGGPFDGRTLHSIITESPDAILGRAAAGPDGGFPLLLKLLDAHENLSLQVHPSQAYAAAHPAAFFKTEAWVVLAVEPPGLLYAGVDPSVTRESFAQAMTDGTVGELLNAIAVAPGDSIFLKSGMCHSLGAGVLVAEVQTPSDTTFRVFDWNRNDPNRPLHFEQARECVLLGDEQHGDWPVVTRAKEARSETDGTVRRSLLVDSDRFRIEQFECDRDSTRTLSFKMPTNGLPQVWVVVRGEGVIEAADESVSVASGRTVLVPACADSAHITLEVRDNTSPLLLLATPSDPLDQVLA